MRRKEKPTRWKSGALLAGLGLGAAATWWGVQQWRRLKQTPPVSPRSHHAGLAGYFQQVGEWRMFTRVTPNDAPGLPLVLVHGLVMSG
ncbi:MAG: alpha/beta hydrolase, partial [Pantoea piersonii]